VDDDLAKGDRVSIDGEDAESNHAAEEALEPSD
jgi:hypothetical protein